LAPRPEDIHLVEMELVEGEDPAAIQVEAEAFGAVEGPEVDPVVVGAQDQDLLVRLVLP
jgi:hypothetical protein